MARLRRACLCAVLVLTAATSASSDMPSSPPWTPAGSLTTTRFNHTANLLSNGRVLVAGGYSDFFSTATASADLYDPTTNLWTATTPMSTARAQHTATALPGGKILVAGGISPATAPIPSPIATAEIYDEATQTWSPAASMNEMRYQHVAVALADGRVLVAGGFNSSVLSSAEIYNPSTNTWTLTSPMNAFRYLHTLTLLTNGKVLLAGTWNATGSSAGELFDPVANSWTVTGPMVQRRYHHCATLLPDGKVLAAGGYGFGSIPGFSPPTAGAEVYDPATNAWSAAASMNLPRANHASTVLGNGKYLATGGQTTIPGPPNTAETFDPSTGLWTFIAPMAAGRLLHTATTLPDGRALVVGGAGVSTAERSPSPNLPPVAKAGEDQVVEAQNPNGAMVRLDGSASTDAEGPIPTYQWSENGSALGTGAILDVLLSEGIHDITLRVVDAGGLSSTDVVSIAVVDTTPPAIQSTSATPSVIWPPNQKIIPVTVTAPASDLADPAPVVRIISVASNQPQSPAGDWAISGPLTVLLRADRDGNSDRTYTLTVEARDRRGNTSTATVTVRVGMP